MTYTKDNTTHRKLPASIKTATGDTLCNPKHADMLAAGWTYTPTPEPTQPTLEEVKTSQKAQIKWAFDRAGDTEGDLNRFGFVMQCGEKHITRMQSLYDYLTSLGLTDTDDSPTRLRSLDNTSHPVKVGDIPLVRLDMIKAGAARIEKKWALEAQIDAGATIEKVKAVVW